MERVFRAYYRRVSGRLPGGHSCRAGNRATFRAVAGEARTAAQDDGVPPMTAITSTRTTPPLEFPIRVLTTEPSGETRDTARNAAGGLYRRIAGRGPDGSQHFDGAEDHGRCCDLFAGSRRRTASRDPAERISARLRVIPPAAHCLRSIPSASSRRCCRRTAWASPISITAPTAIFQSSNWPAAQHLPRRASIHGRHAASPRSISWFTAWAG